MRASPAKPLLIARTDAVAVEGFEAALDRADAYAEAGADLIFVEAPRDRDQLAAIAQRFAGRKPVMANMVEGGKHADPVRGRAAGARLPARHLPRRHGARAGLRRCRSTSPASRRTAPPTPFKDRMLDFKGINRLIATDEFLARGKTYDPAEAAE